MQKVLTITLFVCRIKFVIKIVCPCSSVDRAFGCGPKGRRFNSYQGHINKTALNI